MERKRIQAEATEGGFDVSGGVAAVAGDIDVRVGATSRMGTLKSVIGSGAAGEGGVGGVRIDGNGGQAGS